MNKSKEMMMITAVLLVLNGAAYAADFENLGVGVEEPSAPSNTGDLPTNAACVSAAA